MRHDSLTKIQQTSSVESLVIAWAEEVGGMRMVVVEDCPFETGRMLPRNLEHA